LVYEGHTEQGIWGLTEAVTKGDKALDFTQGGKFLNEMSDSACLATTRQFLEITL
jgi:hypothetical protein